MVLQQSETGGQLDFFDLIQKPVDEGNPILAFLVTLILYFPAAVQKIIQKREVLDGVFMLAISPIALPTAPFVSAIIAGVNLFEKNNALTSLMKQKYEILS